MLQLGFNTLRQMHMEENSGHGGGWTTLPVTAEEKSWLETYLMKQVRKQGGAVTQNVALKLASMRQVRDRFSQSPLSAADLVWAWVASKKRSSLLIHPHVTRLTGAAGSPPAAFWEDVALAKVGWTRLDRTRVSYSQLRRLTVTAKILQVLHGLHPHGDIAVATRVPMFVTASQVEMARQRIKGYAEVKLGGSEYVWGCIAWLMRAGWVEGHVCPKYSARW